jgi:hypothetical protein
VAQVRESGGRLTGPDSFLSQMVKEVLEAGLEAELTEHLGYAKHDAAGRNSGNSRNGATPKTVFTEIGPVDLAVARDRAGTFEPVLLPKHQTRLGGLSDIIISLYAGGMTVRDIGHHLQRVYGTELSHDTISTVTDAVLERVKAWQTRPLDEVYPIMYVDALMVKVRDGAHVRKQGRPPRGRRRPGRHQARAGYLGGEHRGHPRRRRTRIDLERSALECRSVQAPAAAVDRGAARVLPRQPARPRRQSFNSSGPGGEEIERAEPVSVAQLSSDLGSPAYRICSARRKPEADQRLRNGRMNARARTHFVTRNRERSRFISLRVVWNLGLVLIFNSQAQTVYVRGRPGQRPLGC